VKCSRESISRRKSELTLQGRWAIFQPYAYKQVVSVPRGVRNGSGLDDSFAALLHEVADRVRQLAVVPLLPEIVEKCRFRRRFLLEN
jgi:hypothetical protein